jgi:hypothetical protein
MAFGVKKIFPALSLHNFAVLCSPFGKLRVISRFKHSSHALALVFQGNRSEES